MDPNTMLNNMHEAIEDWVSTLVKADQTLSAGDFPYAEGLYIQVSDAARHAIAFATALDEWLSNGGALPEAWFRS